MRLGTEVLDVNSEGYAAFQKFLNGLEYFPESLRFRGQVKGMLEIYFELIKHRGTDSYAAPTHYILLTEGYNTCYCNNIVPVKPNDLP